MGYNYELEILRSKKIYDNIDAAWSALIKYPKHMIGQLLVLLYKKPEDEDKIGTLLAIGTKDSRSEPGCGVEYFEVIPTIGSKQFQSDNTLYTTTVNQNGISYKVSNNEEYTNISDPFEWDEIE